MKYINYFQPITWIRYYMVLLIYFNIRFTQHPVIIVLCFVMLYLFIALSMSPLNYKIIKTNFAGKIIYWARFLIKILVFFIAGNSDFYFTIIIILISILIEAIADLYLYKNISKIFDINSFHLRNKYIQEGAFLIVKERKIQKIFYKFIKVLCIINVITAPFILHRQFGFSNSFFIGLLISELICLMIITFIFLKDQK